MEFPHKKFGLILSAVVIVTLIVYSRSFDRNALSSPEPEDFSGEGLHSQKQTAGSLSHAAVIDPDRDYALVDIAELEARLAAFFATADLQGRTLDTIPPIDIDQILDRQRNYAFIEIQYWLGLAIDLGLTLDGFEKYGLEALEDGKYKFDLKKYPEWIEQRVSLERFLDRDELVSRILVPRGLSQDNLKALESYLASRNPKLGANVALLSVIDTEYAKADSLQLHPRYDQAVFRSLFFQLNYLTYMATAKAWTDWSLDLFEQLDRGGQELLIDFIRDSVDYRTAIPNQLENVEQLYIEELESLQWRKEIRTKIESLQGICIQYDRKCQ